MSEPHTGRAAFGRRLRVLRVEADLSGKELAQRLGWAPSKVSKLEHGQQAATAADVAAWAGAVGASAAVREGLLADLHSLRVDYATWRQQFRTGGYGRRQRASVALESAASLIRAYETDAVPGLLQTPQYARHLFARLAEFRKLATDVEEGVRARMHRQEVLYQPGKHFRFLVGEAALHHRVCPPAVLRGQLDRLVVLADLDTVELAVVPLDAALPNSPWHGFWIFDDTLVLVETLTAELSLRDVEDIETYSRFFESLWQVASHGQEAVALLRRLIADLGPPGSPDLTSSGS